MKSSSKNNKPSSKLGVLKPILFVEGGAIMGLQIIGGKTLTLYYGVGIQVWTSTITISMVCLAIGYYLGGKLSSNKEPIKIIRNILLAASCYILLLGFLSNSILDVLLMENTILGSLVSAFVIIGPCTILFGMVGPIISQLLSTYVIKKSGQAAGKTFLISTFGGVLSIFMFGLALIPKIGISNSFIAVGVSLAIIALPVLKPSRFHPLQGA